MQKQKGIDMHAWSLDTWICFNTQLECSLEERVYKFWEAEPESLLRKLAKANEGQGFWQDYMRETSREKQRKGSLQEPSQQWWQLHQEQDYLELRLGMCCHANLTPQQMQMRKHSCPWSVCLAEEILNLWWYRSWPSLRLPFPTNPWW